MVGLSAADRVVGQCQDRLYHPRIGIFSLRGKDNDRPGFVGIDQLQIVDVDRVSGPADDARVLRLAHPVADLVLHLDLVLLGQDGDAGARAALVSGDELGDDREDLG